MNKRDLYNACEARAEKNRPLDAADHYHLEACSNAGYTCDENGQDRGPLFRPSDEFIEHWYGTLGSNLSCYDADPVATAHYKALGVEW